MLIVGQGALARADGAQILAAAAQLAQSSGMIKEGWNGFNVLHTAASRVGGLDLGFVPRRAVAATWPASSRAPRAAPSTWSICSAPTRST